MNTLLRSAVAVILIGYVVIVSAQAQVPSTNVPAAPAAPATADPNALPPRPDPRIAMKGTIEFYDINIPGNGPGRPMELNLYLPAGRHDPKSLPCVIIAPAGSGMHGMTIGDGDRPEHIPYVKAGFAVMVYELSGSMTLPPKDSYSFAEMEPPTKQFMEADGGLMNGRTAIDYVLKYVPEVDPSQLYACGHSSAATMALNLALNDARIHACCAYAPQVDATKWWNMGMDQFITGYKDFAVKMSPIAHVADFKCPVYLFHADDDSMVTLASVQGFVDAMKAAGKPITFETVPTGEHYDSMIEHGIPGGIKFMESQGAKPLPPVVATANP